jgi:DNA-binding SARP family transcriptional activator
VIPLCRTVLAAAGRLARGLFALTALVGLLVGLPWLLVVFIGWPLPDHLLSLNELTTTLTRPLDDATALNAFAVLGWLLWLAFVRDVIVETMLTVAQVCAGQPRRPAAGGPVRLVAAVLVGAMATALALDVVRDIHASGRVDMVNVASRTPATAPADPHVTRSTAGASMADGSSTASATRSASPITFTPAAIHRAGNEVPAWARDAPGGIHRVVAGDNLWDIAQAKLGDPHRWREIYVLNRGKPQPNGGALTDPDMIHIDWVLALPARFHQPTPPQAVPSQPPPAGPGQPPQIPDPTGMAPGPITPTPQPGGPACSIPASAVPAPPTVAAPAPTGTSSPDRTNVPTALPGPGSQPSDHQPQGRSVSLPSGAWIPIGLAAAIAAAVTAVRLHARRNASLPWPIPTTATPGHPPVPDSLQAAEEAGSRTLDLQGSDLPGVLPTPPATPAAVGVDADGREISLYQITATGLALTGPGTEPAARAMLAAAVSTAVLHAVADRPIIITATGTLARLLPNDDTEPSGLDPDNRSYDGERLNLTADTDAALAAFEAEMLTRRRILDDHDAATAAELRDCDDTIEYLAPYLLITDANPDHIARLRAVLRHCPALNMYAVALGAAAGIPACDLAGDGTIKTVDSGEGDTHSPTGVLAPGGRLATFTATELADLLTLLRLASYQQETTPDENPGSPTAAGHDLPPAETPVISAPTAAEDAVVRLTVLGGVRLATADGPITSNIRNHSYALLALLAAHPNGRSLQEIAANLFPDTDPKPALNLIRTATNSLRHTLRTATGQPAKFILYEAGRYRIDPHHVDVDLWRMLTAIDRANQAADDDTCLTALREAASLYHGDFAASQPHAWITDHTTSYRHKILAAYARIAELTELDHPDQAINVLETALQYDPINEELYQRIIRIHGRQRHPDAVRRTLHLCETRLATIGETEPSPTTYRVVQRQLDLTEHGAHASENRAGPAIRR